MTPSFSVRSTPRFERLFRNLLKAHRELRVIRERVGEILETDPYNLTRRYNIKKATGFLTRAVVTLTGSSGAPTLPS